MTEWKYSGRFGGTHDTRHEAIGAAAVTARVQRERRREIDGEAAEDFPSPLRAVGMVYAHPPYVCSYCTETFMTEDEYDQHDPCPLWVEKVEQAGEP